MCAQPIQLRLEETMPVPRDAAALAALSRLLTHGHHDDPNELLEYPDTTIEPPDGWLWQQHTPQPGLLDPTSYQLADSTVDAHDLHASPVAALADGGNKPFTAAQNEYCRRSLDVTMKGGTTSAVIYPLALCELARHFRFRNLGGASAGAIAAALGASAELGRVRATAGRQRTDVLGEHQVAQGRLRQGFAGLADVIAWVTQPDAPDAAEEYRLVQLFKPTQAGLPLFRVIAAVMRQQFVRGALLLLLSLNTASRIVTLAAFALAPLGLAAVAPWSPTRWVPTSAWWPYPYYWPAAVLLWLAFGWLIPLAALIATRPRSTTAAPAGFEEPLPVPDPPAKPRAWFGTAIVAGAAAVAWFATALYTMGWAGLLITVVFLIAEVVLVLLGFALGIMRVSATAKQHRYGLIGGSGLATDDDTLRGRLTALIDGASQVLPRRTVEPNLTDWLTQAMADLAGLPAHEVVRFGHLWTGADYVPGDPDGAARQAAKDSRQRCINLELMSTELIRKAPYRFPLPAAASDDERLWFDPGDLDGVLPRRVIDAMTLNEQPQQVTSLTTGAPITLYRFPQPWDLPVVFATRASLALPALFQSLRLYELRQGAMRVRTEFGARIARNGTDLRFPISRAGEARVAQELWLTDGGVTSNFPIHMFDSPLPLWPTVGIDLGDYPAGAGHQDVYLLGDAQAAKHLAAPLKQAMSSFLGAILGTSLQWRDNAQLQMPAFQARIAVVRQRTYEGGNNLFMTRQDVASLAIRGVVAGMRLRRRFASDAQWQRQQWLRLRVAGQNIVDVAQRLQTSLREQTYAELVPNQLTGHEWARLDALEASVAGQADPNPPSGPPDAPEAPLDWYAPSGPRTEIGLDEHGRPVGFFANLTTLVSSSRYLNADPDVLTDGVPLPLAELRQVPRS